MKKILWLLATIVACFAWFIVLPLALMFLGVFIRIFTGSDDWSIITNIFPYIQFVGLIAIVVISIKLWKGQFLKCSTCKKLKTLNVIKTELIREEDIVILMEVNNRNLKQEVTSTSGQYIPGKRKVYRDTYKCTFCNNLETHTRTTEKANV